MNMVDNALPQKHINPGELYFAMQPTNIITILGSCLSVTMYNPASRIGAMCHGFLPSGDCTLQQGQPFRFVDCAIIQMVQAFDKLAIPRKSIDVKIFGGASSLTSQKFAGRIASVGDQNIKRASEILEDFGLIVKAQDIGGTVGRKIIFNTGTGDVFLRKLHSQFKPIVRGEVKR